ncbi:LAMI_0G08372g1_1 [Lachancea mirantina]|uniref:LAMI_0G08372g1_1 n=1 Tax=Lachancea mirantina TaxID=1230905 RepID=A0A1G4K9V8_9SACH|nr:LAMI_0G08372g1_1 [Lachancea mirantina]
MLNYPNSEMIFNASQQTLSYSSLYGNDTTISFSDLNDIVATRQSESIISGARLSAAGLALIILWMVSQRRTTPIFIANQVSLTLMVIQSSLLIAYSYTHYSSITFTLTMFPQYVPRSDLYFFGASNIFQALLVAAVEVSLVLQVRVVFKCDNFKNAGRALTAMSAALAGATTGMFFATAIQSTIAAHENVSSVPPTILYNAAVILMACSVNFMTLLLAIKLILAIRSRRFLGLKQFDSLHILLIMAFQTLVFPSILFILSYSLNGKSGTGDLEAIAILLVTLSLPLSSMWATSANNSNKPTSVNTQFSPRPYTSSSYGSEDMTVYSRNMNSCSSGSEKNKLYDLYPVEGKGNHCGNSAGDGYLGKDNYDYSAQSIGSAQNSSMTENETRNHLNPSRYGISDNLRDMNIASNATVKTPDTLDDEEARKFWSLAEN